MPRVLGTSDRDYEDNPDGIILVFFLVAIPLCLVLDAVLLSDHIWEGGFTETKQSGLVLFSSLVFAQGARRFSQASSYLWVVALFLAALFIRENDAVLDHISHGFWAYLVLPLVIVAGLIAWRGRGDLRQAFARHRASGTLMHVLIGLGILIVISRLVGSGMVWRPLLGEDYTWQFKSIIQEGLELVGHAWLAYGSYLSYRENFGQRAPRQQ
ncbi:MAG: hypothetical protein P1U53_03250 [Sulfitobacter sp.]|nr:hypothetical protein [Sulfitobacter sp.]